MLITMLIRDVCNPESVSVLHGCDQVESLRRTFRNYPGGKLEGDMVIEWDTDYPLITVKDCVTALRRRAIDKLTRDEQSSFSSYPKATPHGIRLYVPPARFNAMMMAIHEAVFNAILAETRVELGPEPLDHIGG